jgi:hypothetical protein
MKEPPVRWSSWTPQHDRGSARHKFGHVALFIGLIALALTVGRLEFIPVEYRWLTAIGAVLGAVWAISEAVKDVRNTYLDWKLGARELQYRDKQIRNGKPPADRDPVVRRYGEVVEPQRQRYEPEPQPRPAAPRQTVAPVEPPQQQPKQDLKGMLWRETSKLLTETLQEAFSPSTASEEDGLTAEQEEVLALWRQLSELGISRNRLVPQYLDRAAYDRLIETFESLGLIVGRNAISKKPGTLVPYRQAMDIIKNHRADLAKLGSQAKLPRLGRRKVRRNP